MEIEVHTLISTVAKDQWGLELDEDYDDILPNPLSSDAKQNEAYVDTVPDENEAQTTFALGGL